MDLPKCRICGEKHRLGGCPSSIQRAPKSRPEAQKVEQPRELRGKDAGSIPAGPPTKPAKKAKPKKKGKTKNLPAAPTVKVGKPASKEAVIKAIENGAIEKAIRVGPPRKGEEHKTLTATKPWEKLKPPCSRASYYRKIKQGKIVP